MSFMANLTSVVMSNKGMQMMNRIAFIVASAFT
jgi:hypothetical protein